MTDETKYDGYEYAVHRISPEAWLFDADGDGMDASWEGDMENASWMGTEKLAEALADINGLTDEEGVLVENIDIVKRGYMFDEDAEPDDIDRLVDQSERW